MTEIVEKLAHTVQLALAKVQVGGIHSDDAACVARAVLSTLADNLTPELVEAAALVGNLPEAAAREALTAALRSAVGE